MKELNICNACAREYEMEGSIFILEYITVDRNTEREMDE
jgi:hypothetical protein